jgi:colanic acid/amylovoran biosynthesis glycosyltransferase
VTPLRPGESPIRLLEVGLMWPPETFLQWRFRGLVDRGMRITVASSDLRPSPPGLEGVRLVALPDWDEPRRAIVAGIAWDTLRLLLISPRRLARLLIACRRAWRRSGRWTATAQQRRWRALARLRGFLPLARHTPDIVHFEWESAAVAHRPLLDVWRCPMVISCHGGLQVWAHTTTHAETIDELPGVFRAAAAVHCVSAAVRAEATRYGVDPAKLRLIPTAVDPNVFRPPAEPRAPGAALRIVGVGWLKWLKGFEYAVQAVAALLRDGVPARLDLLGHDPALSSGEPSDRPRVRHAIDELELRGHVHLHGQVRPDEVVAHLQRADVLLHPSLSEGLPTVVLEAMACELPVVVTDSGGVREAVSDGVEGLVVPPRDPSRMAAALGTLWRDPDLRRRMGAAGRARVEEAFTLAAQIQAFLDLYAAVGANGRRPQEVPAFASAPPTTGRDPALRR